MRVLVLDDDPLTAFALSRLFAMRGVQVVTVATAEAAERTLESGQFDALLVDAQADQAKGLRVLALARRLKGGIALFVVSNGTPDGGSPADADIYYIEKPWDGLFLVDAVRARCDGDSLGEGASGRLGRQEERPTVDIRPTRKERRPARESSAP